MIAAAGDEYLRLVLQAPKGRRLNDPPPVNQQRWEGTDIRILVVATVVVDTIRSDQSERFPCHAQEDSGLEKRLKRPYGLSRLFG